MPPVTDIVELPPDAPAPAPAPVVRSVSEKGKGPATSGPTVSSGDVKRSIYLATPCFACLLSNSFAASLIALQALCARRGVLIHVDFIGNESLVERARNVLVARYLKYSDFTHFLFIDADIGFNPDLVFRLLDFDKDVVGAVYPKKSIDWAKVADKIKAGDPEDIRQMGLDFNINLKTLDPPDNGFVKVLDTATGFMMIKRGVLEKMYEHYREELFAVNDIQGQNVDDYVALFACMIDPETKRFLSEDYAFCRRYQQMGGDIWCDLASPLSHTGTNIFRGDITQRFAVGA